jgi:hypothetical protein
MFCAAGAGDVPTVDLRRRRRVATDIDSNSPKVHRREDYFVTVHMKPYTSSFLLSSCRVVYHLLRQRPHPPSRLFLPRASCLQAIS